MVRFIITPNRFLKKSITGYYHQNYTGYKKPGNPDFLNTLKNTFQTEHKSDLIVSRNKVRDILIKDIPKIIEETDNANWICVCVPRAKALKKYADSQLMFLDAVGAAANSVNGVADGTDCIIRVVDTFTTHLRNASNILNEGDKPYPGIIVETCKIDRDRIKNQNIILVDDIYTSNVNIDEDCIQALLDNDANKVVFYSIGYTRRDK